MSKVLPMFILGGLLAAMTPGHVSGQRRPARPEQPPPPRQLEISDTVACGDCAIRTTEVTTLRWNAGATLGEVSISHDRRGRWYVVRSSNPGVIEVFDSAGRSAGAIGRLGGGQGQYRTPEAPMFFGDTMYLYDRGALRLTKLSSEGRYLSNVQVGSALENLRPLDDGSFIAGDEAGYLSAFVPGITRVGRDGRYRGSIGSRPLEAPERFASRVVAPGKGAHIWAAPMTRYWIEYFDTTNVKSLEITRKARWFRTYPLSEVRPPLAGEQPRPRIQSLWEDPRGLLWVMVRIADTTWNEGVMQIRADSVNYLRPERPGSSQKVPTRAGEDLLYDTLIEVLDVKTGRLVAVKRLPRAYTGFVGDGFVFTEGANPKDQPAITVWRLHLDGYRASPAKKLTIR